MTADTKHFHFGRETAPILPGREDLPDRRGRGFVTGTTMVINIVIGYAGCEYT